MSRAPARVCPACGQALAESRGRCPSCHADTAGGVILDADGASRERRGARRAVLVVSLFYAAALAAAAALAW